MDETLALFAHTEVFIYVFAEIVSKLAPVQRVIFKKALWQDKLIFILLFGGFSIFGTYIGIPLPSGVISNIRDLSPIMAGLAAGPVAGLAVGLIGGIHRLLLGGFTGVPCALATILAGIIAGAFYKFNKGKIVGILYSMLIAAIIELVHAGLTLLIARPFSEALDAVLNATPAMIVANALGIAIAVIIIRNTKDVQVSTPERVQVSTQE
jgi:sigma-B regulation protein RsbU (phosphoserine phosphatase)